MNNKFNMRSMTEEESNIYRKAINDLFESTRRNIFDDNVFSPVEIQYIRGLIMNDKITNDYIVEGMNAKIDQKMSMHEFTERLLEKLDRLEDL